MHLDGMNFFKLEVLIAIVETSSFSAASEQLNLTQPAVSRHVRELEQICGTPLFVRLSRGVEPTDFGHIMYHYALEVISGARDLLSNVNELVKGSGGRISLGTTPTFAQYLLPQALELFFEQNPDVKVDIDLSGTDVCCAKVLEGSLDFCIIHVTHLLDLPSWIERHELYQDKLVLVTNPSTAGSIVEPISADEFAKIPFLAPNSETFHTLIVSELVRCGLDVPPIRIRASGLDTAKTLTMRGLGMSILPKSSIIGELKSGQLRKVKIAGDPELNIRYTLINRSTRIASLSASKLIKFITNVTRNFDHSI